MVARMKNIEHLIGQKFNKLTILKDLGKVNKRRYVLVKCDCGSGETSMRLDAVTSSSIKSCGCLKKEANKKYNTYDLKGEYGIGYTFKNEPFYFDLEDYDLIKDICWLSDKGYIRGYLNNKMVSMHNLIMDSLFIDHIYHNKYDNRKENLRKCSNSQNIMNTKSKNKYGIKGISWHTESKQWFVHLNIKDKINYIKRFKNITDAINKRIELEKEYFGEYRYIWENNIKWDLLLEYEKELRGGVVT